MENLAQSISFSRSQDRGRSDLGELADDILPSRRSSTGTPRTSSSLVPTGRMYSARRPTSLSSTPQPCFSVSGTMDGGRHSDRGSSLLNQRGWGRRSITLGEIQEQKLYQLVEEWRQEPRIPRGRGYAHTATTRDCLCNTVASSLRLRGDKGSVTLSLIPMTEDPFAAGSTMANSPVWDARLGSRHSPRNAARTRS